MAIALAERIARRITIEILRGDHAPGMRLPTVRELARRYGSATPTVHRAIGRLQEAGLVIAKRGSGVTVLDPKRSGDLSLLPLWFEALRDRPEQAAAILRDFLELRRVVVIHLLRTSTPRIRAATDQLAPLVASAVSVDRYPEIAEADLAVLAALIDAAGQRAIAAVFHACARLVRQVPAVARALYGDRTAYRRSLRTITRAISRGGDRGADAIDRVLAEADRVAIARFLYSPR